MDEDRTPTTGNYIAMLQTTIGMAERCCVEAQELATRESGWLALELQAIQRDLFHVEKRVIDARRSYVERQHEDRAPDYGERAPAHLVPGPQIVVIDDEPTVLEVLQDLFEMEGFSVLSMDHVEDGEIVRQAPPPAMFLIDLMLPGISGVELAQTFRTSGFGSTPMIGMSASKFMVDSAIQTHLFDAVVLKPFDVNNLVSLVKRYAA